MPPRGPRSSTRRSAPPFIDQTVLGVLSLEDLRSLYIQHGLPSTGVRKTFERRLREQTSNRNEPAAAQPGQNITSDTSASRQDFSEGQMQTIRQLIQDTIHQSSLEIANEAAKAAVDAFQAQASSRARLPAQRPPSLIVPDTERATRAAGVTFASPFQDIPAQYIKDIQSGEFFDLTKLLPKNLSLYDEDDNLVLSLDNSVVKVSRKSKPTASTSIANIEQRTMAFTSCTSVLIHKFPTRSQELLQYVSLIRYAARVHKGLGWAIYDFKFRQKASLLIGQLSTISYG